MMDRSQYGRFGLSESVVQHEPGVFLTDETEIRNAADNADEPSERRYRRPAANQQGPDQVPRS